MSNRNPNATGTLGLGAHGIVLGCDYNPEQWPVETWHEDMALMQEAGVGIVAINVFGWSQVNPGPGEWSFDALDKAMDLLHASGIKANLGTGTASTPAWLTTKFPEVLPAAIDGTPRFPGGRQAWCPSSAIYREYSLQLVDKIASRYADHPALAMWHVSNELGCHNALCYCDNSAAAFRVWLQDTYGTVEAVNEAWGTAFWSQRYTAFDQIHTPRLTLSTRNPGQVLDFQRFSSQQLLEQYQAEAAVIKTHSDKPVTTNFMVTAHIRNLDYWQWAPQVDLVANDHYLDHRLADPTTEMGFAADLTRGLAGGKPWMLMETAVGAVNWQPLNVNRQAGELVRHAVSHIARGSDSICFFQWRASRQGSEKFHSAMVPHAGTDSQGWRDTLELSAALKALAPVVGSTVASRAALIFDWASWWTLDADNTPSSHVRYLDQVHAAYTAARQAGLGLDIVAAGADLSAYSLVIAPALHSIGDAHAQAIDAFVAAGGHALVTFASGIVDEHDAVRLGGYPGAFSSMLGLKSDAFYPVAPEQRLTLSDGTTGSLWSENVTVDGAQVLATFAGGPVEGFPAVTVNNRGKGKAWYVATALDASGYASLLTSIAAQAQLPLNPGLDVVVRHGEDATFVFAINHGSDNVDYEFHGVDLLSGEHLDGPAAVAPGTARVVREEKP